MSLDWRPERPCREEVAAVIAFLRDSLEAQGLEYECDQVEENADCFFITATDKQGYVNAGFAGWSDDLARMAYACFDAPRLKRDLAEGFQEDESKCFIQPESAMLMLLFLTGKVRKIADLMRREELQRQAEEDAREAA